MGRIAKKRLGNPRWCKKCPKFMKRQDTQKGVKYSSMT
jgi:hypothetical protein